jgi:hypothetical protein
MKLTGPLLTLAGIAALAVMGLVLSQAQAADNAGIAKIVDLLKAGKTADAKAAAKAYAMKNGDLDDLMGGFSKNGLVAIGVGKKLRDWTKGPAAADLNDAALQDLGAMSAAIAMVCESAKAPKGSGDEWIKLAKDMGDKSMKLQAALKTKQAAGVKTAAVALNESCDKCHVKFRD